MPEVVAEGRRRESQQWVQATLYWHLRWETVYQKADTLQMRNSEIDVVDQRTLAAAASEDEL
jgi:hypothetical protein